MKDVNVDDLEKLLSEKPLQISIQQFMYLVIMLLAKQEGQNQLIIRRLLTMQEEIKGSTGQELSEKVAEQEAEFKKLVDDFCEKRTMDIISRIGQ